MNTRKCLLHYLCAAIAVAALIISVAGVPQQPVIKRTQLLRHDISIRGWEAVTVRIDFPEGSEFGRHSHPGEEIIFVVAGTFEYNVESQPPIVLKAGGVLFIPAGTIHAARNIGPGSASELATYIVEKNKPLITMMKHEH